MTQSADTRDWRIKLAEEIRPGRPEIERAFAQQAYSFIKAKAGALMDDNSCLGFELIHSNDDNTRIIGAFVFRVAESLWLAPIFFLNGQIKGDQFLWDCKRKLFKPLCTEWAEKIIRGSRASQSDTGRTMPRAEADRHSGLGYDLATIARQPHSLVSKTGAFKESIGVAALLTEAQVGEMFTANDEAPVGVLTRKHLKVASAEMIESLVGGLSGDNVKVAEMLLQFTDGDITPYTEALSASLATTKVANAEPALTFRCGNLSKTAAQDVSNVPHVMTAWKHAFEIEDPRHEDETVRMVQTDVVFENLNAGNVVDIPVIGDETLSRVYVAAGVELNALDLSVGYGGTHDSDCCYNSGYTPRLSLYFLSDKTVRKVAPGAINGIGLTDEIVDAKDTLEKAAVEPKESGVYYLATLGGNSITSQPFLIVEIDKRSDKYAHMRLVTVYEGGGVSSEFTVLCDKTRRSDFKSGVIGSDAVFLECEMVAIPSGWPGCGPLSECYPSTKDKMPKEAPIPIPAKSLFDIVTQNNGLQISVSKGKNSYKLKVACQGKAVQNFELDHPVKLAAALCLRVGLSGDDAMSVIHEVDNSISTVKFATIAPTTKTASSMPSSAMMRGYTQREPNWNPNFDSYNNVLVDWPREFQTQVSQQVAGRPSMNNNEMMQLLINEGSKNAPSQTQNPDILPVDELMKLNPSDIEKAIHDRNLLHAVEHGVIAQLVRTYDVGRVISDLIPDIEIGVDRIGRLLFLFYWKPSDFEKLYGSDELVQRETQLSGTFRSLGLLVLDLLKRPIDANGASQAL